jgi:hypothetical protein
VAAFTNSLKQKLEHLLDMGGGYVLDFTNATFSDFVQTSIGIDPYETYDGSKANILRKLWQDLDTESACSLTLELLDRWRTNSLIGIRPQLADLKLYEAAKKEVEDLRESGAGVTPSDLDFLDKDLGEVDISKVNIPLDFRTVVDERLAEIDRCVAAKAPLAVIFLCGSTIEGLLSAVALKQPEAFASSKSAPRLKGGKVKPLDTWTLSELITSAHELRLIGQDVVKHAHAVRDFRNYIHPRQQTKENFSPRMITADIASKVLQATIHDLGALG